MSSMKKYLVSFLFLVGFIVSIVFQRSTRLSDDFAFESLFDKEESEEEEMEQQPVISTQPTTPAPVVSKPSTVVSTTTSQGTYRNGTYTGEAIDATYGIIQVKAVITEGKISDVVFLSYPNDRENSLRISTMAMPLLRQEAIAVQSEKVNSVSGASYTSAAFKKSLASALSQCMM